MRRKNGKKRKLTRKAGFLTLFVVFALALIIGFKIISVYQRLGDAREQEDALCEQLEEQQQENAALRSDLDHADDPNFWKKLARENDLYEDGSRIFVDVNN